MNYVLILFFPLPPPTNTQAIVGFRIGEPVRGCVWDTEWGAWLGEDCEFSPSFGQASGSLMGSPSLPDGLARLSAL